MKKLGYVLMPVFVFALALSAAAQGNERPVNTDKSETVKVNVSGEINVDGVFRSADLMGSRGATTGFNSSSQFTVEGWLRLRLDIELTEKVSAVLSLRNQRVNGSTGTGPLAGPAGTGTSVFGTQGTGLIVDKATVSFNEFFTAGLKLTVGIDPDTAFDLRGKGSAFFFDPAHSHTMAKNLGVGESVTLNTYAPNQLQPAGLHLVYGKDMLNLGMFLLPAVIEGGTNATGDEAAYGAWFTYGIEISGNKQSKVGLLFVYDNLPGTNFDVFTIGGGADIHNLVEGLELYAELYFQFGKVGAATAAGSGATDTTSARGWAFQLGGQYNLPKNENDIWFGLNFTYVSGEAAGSGSPAEAKNNSNKNFLSYENVNDLLIVEDQIFGVDIDTNYWTIKGGVGGSLKVGSAATNNLHLSLGLGYARLVNELFTGTSSETKTIGFEIDPTIAYDVNKQVSAYTKFGVLFSSDVLAKRNLGGPGSTGTDASTTVWTWVLGVDAKF